MKTLTPRQASFVKFYIQHSNARQAAVQAGYSEKNAAKTAGFLLKGNKAVMSAIAEHRKEIVDSGKYSYDRAMAEAERCFKFAEQTENANAMVRAAELRSKLSGLLIERHDVRAAIGFSIVIQGVNDIEITGANRLSSESKSVTPDVEQKKEGIDEPTY